ncbi:hypothetical protein Tco_0115759 [Tanacetum coccineum]
MPPKRSKKKSIKKLVEKRVAKAIEEYEKSRTNLDSAGSSGGDNENAGRTMNVQGCSHKNFLNGKPHSFKGTEGVVGLRRWIEKVEQVFETGKCAEEDKVMFAASTFEGRDDIEAYNNCFHELALMCPELVPTKRKKIEKYVRGFPERIKGNITSSKPATLHDASTWPVNWSSNQFRSQLRVKFMLEIYLSATVTTFTIVGNALRSVKSAKIAGIWRKIDRLDPKCRRLPLYKIVSCHGWGKKDHFRNRSPKAGNSRMWEIKKPLCEAYAVGENPFPTESKCGRGLLVKKAYPYSSFDGQRFLKSKERGRKKDSGFTACIKADAKEA